MALIDSLTDDGWAESDLELLVYTLLVKNDETLMLNAALRSAPDRLARNEEIIRAVQAVKGKGYGFSGHGISRLIDGRFDDAQKADIVTLMHRFSCQLRDALDIQSFITSGTLLGMFREGRFLPHDDDFDMAYVSNFTDKSEIVAERARLFDAVSGFENFTIREETGGRATIRVTGDSVRFNFDLFTAFRNGAYFNECPLKPDTAFFDDIMPVKTAKLYGQDIFVPQNPEKLLEVNYGSGWKTPDPSFRFWFDKHRKYYDFLFEPVRAAKKAETGKL